MLYQRGALSFILHHRHFVYLETRASVIIVDHRVTSHTPDKLMTLKEALFVFSQSHQN